MCASPDAETAWTAGGRLIAAAIGLATFATQFDVTAVVVVLPAIGREIGLPVAALAWIIDAYSIAFTTTLLVAGALTDRFGRRGSLLLGCGMFLVASLACGLARDAAVFLAARAVQGAGAAFLVTGAFASIATAFRSPAARAHAFGLVGVISGVAMALGPSLGGVIGSWLDWRWIFLANLPLCILIAVVVPGVVPEHRHGAGRPLHWPSVITLALALGLTIDALLAARHGLLHPAAGLAAATVMLVVFVHHQRRQMQPMFDPAVFANRAMLGIAILLMAVSIGYWALLVYLPMFLGQAFGWTTETTGLGLLAATLPMLVVPPFGARLAPRLGSRRFFATALFVMAAGGLVLSLAALRVDTATVPVATLLGMAAVGLGAALSHPQLSGALLSFAPPETSGMASAVTVVARQGGFALGAAALGAVVPLEPGGAGFAWAFTIATAASAAGAIACALLPPAKGRRAEH